MSKFILRSILFFLPFLLAFPIEKSVENNSFKIKSDYIEKNKSNIEILLLGSSQNNKAINSEFLDFKIAPLANDGSTINIDFLLFEEYFPKLPNLKIVIFELSYHSLEDLKPNNWNKNHLFLKFYNINNYGKNPPLSEQFLITSNPKEYLKKYFTPNLKLKDNKYNPFGYTLNSPSRFKKYNYNKKLIDKTSMDEYLRYRHQTENIKNYHINTKLLKKAIKICSRNNIKFVFLSPPKYYLYNNHLNKKRANRRNLFLEETLTIKNLYVWNFEHLYENKTEYFLNEDHLNYKGSKQFTTVINQKLKYLISY